MFLKFKQFFLKNDKQGLFIFIIIYISIFFALSLKKYYNFDYNLLDLSIFNQVFFNTLHGNWFVDTVNIDIYLADHFTPIIFLLLPFYWFWQNVQSLLFLQTLVIALSAWPLYLIAKDASKDKGISWLVVALWLLSPFVHTTNLLEFHLLPLAALFIFWTFYFYRQKKFNFFILFFILALLVREDISFILIAFALFSFLDKRSLRWRLSSLILPIIYFFVAYNIISYFAPTGTNKFLIYYGWLGGDAFLPIILNWLKNPLDVLAHIFTWKNLLGIVVLLMPTLFLPLLRPKYLFLALLPFLQILMTSKGFDFSAYSSHYVMLFLPGMFIALIFSLTKIKNKEKFFLSEKIYKNKTNWKIILFITIIYFSIFLSPAKNVLFDNKSNDQAKLKKEFISLIEPDARITAEASFLPSLSSRAVAYPLFYSYFGKNQFAARDFVMPEVDYILIDYSQFLGIIAEKNTTGLLQPFKDKMPENWLKILENYSLVKAENNIYLWQNKALVVLPELSLYKQEKMPADVLSEELLIAWDLDSIGDQKRLKLSLQKTDQSDKEFLIRFYQGEDYFDMPLDYGIWPMSSWPEDELISFYYYPKDNIDSFQIFTWYGSNKLGNKKELVVDKKTSAQTDKISF